MDSERRSRTMMSSLDSYCQCRNWFTIHFHLKSMKTIRYHFLSNILDNLGTTNIPRYYICEKHVMVQHTGTQVLPRIVIHLIYYNAVQKWLKDACIEENDEMCGLFLKWEFNSTCPKCRYACITSEEGIHHIYYKVVQKWLKVACIEWNDEVGVKTNHYCMRIKLHCPNSQCILTNPH